MNGYVPGGDGGFRIRTPPPGPGKRERIKGKLYGAS